MTPEEFRVAAHELIDWLVDRRVAIEDRPVRPPVDPGDIRRALPSQPPQGGDSASDLIADLESIIAPGITEVQHPMHFGWFPSNASLSSILGDFASSGLASLGISWESSPSLTEVEEVVVDWLRELTGLSDAWSGVIQDTASTACLVTMLAAREQATGHAQTGGGVLGFGKRLHVYTTSEAHSSVRKGALLAGFAADDNTIGYYHGTRAAGVGQRRQHGRAGIAEDDERIDSARGHGIDVGDGLLRVPLPVGIKVFGDPWAALRLLTAGLGGDDPPTVAAKPVKQRQRCLVGPAPGRRVLRRGGAA